MLVMPLCVKQRCKLWLGVMLVLCASPALGATEASLQETLAANALILQTRQREKQDLERDLVRLARETIPLQEQYQTWHQRLQSLLIGVQRLVRIPPENIITHPGAPENAIRSGILLRMVIADMDARIAPLRASLAETRIREQEISARKAALTALEQRLADENTQFRLLIDKRQRQIAARAADQPAVSVMPTDAGPTDAETVMGNDDPQLPPPRWVAPLAGPRVSAPAVPAESSGNHQGLWIEASAGDAVLSPADGVVRYVGPFRSYGQIVNIQHGGGYHSLLAGIEAPIVQQGQSILGGEPVARLRGMGLEQGDLASSVAAMPPATTFHTGEVSKTHLLYFEVRYHGKSEMSDHLASLFKKKDSVQ